MDEFSQSQLILQVRLGGEEETSTIPRPHTVLHLGQDRAYLQERGKRYEIHMMGIALWLCDSHLVHFSFMLISAVNQKAPKVCKRHLFNEGK